MRSRRTSRPAARPRAFAIETLEARDVPAVVPLGPEFQVNVSTPGQQFGPEIAASPSGHHVVVWNTEIGGNYGVSARVYDADGVPVSGDIVVAADVGTHYSIASPSVCMDDAGRFLVTWSDGDDVFANGYDADGSALTDAFVVNTTTAGYQKAPAAACDADGNFVVVWQSGASLYGDGVTIVGQRFDLDAEPVGGEFVVNTFAGGAKQAPSVAMDADGDFVVAYESQGQDGPNGQAVYARLYAADGSPQGDEFVIAASAGNWRIAPRVAMDADGDFVVAWYHYRDAVHSGFDVSARRYDASGTAAGDAFRVSPAVSDWGSPGASVAMDAAGRFVVAYPRLYADGSGYGVYARAFDESGVAIGEEFRANSYTPDYQNLSAVEISDVGSFLVAWNSHQDGDSLGVFAQAYTLDGSAEDLAPITGIISTLATPDTASAAPFESVSFHHVPAGATLNVAVTFDEDKGDLSGPASMSGDLASVLAQLRALRFDPADNRVPLGLTETTTITLTVTDGAGYAATDSRTNVVSVSVDAPPQVNGSIDTQTANAGEWFSLDLPTEFVTDPDGDVLTYSADYLPGWLSIDPTDGTLSGTPSSAHAVVGTTEPNVYVVVTASDPAGQTATFVVTILVLDPNAPPYVVPGYYPPFYTPEDSYFEAAGLFASAFQPAVPGHGLSFSFGQLPAWLSYDAATDRLTGTPTQSDVGTNYVERIATDTVNGQSTSHYFEIFVVNVNDPVVLAQPIDDQSAVAGGPFAFTVPEGAFADEDVEDYHTYSTSELPEWLSFNPNMGEFSGTPTNADAGTISITVTRTDSGGTFASDTFALTVTPSNQAPQVNGSLDTETANAGQLFALVLPEGFVTDPDSGDVLTFSADSLPAWLSIDPETGTLSGTPSPADAVVTTEPNVWVIVTATDLHGAYATFPVAINVLDPDAAPYYAGGYTPDISVDEDSAFDEAASSMFASQFRPGYPGNPLSVTITGTPSWMTYDAAADRLFGTPTQADVGTDGFIHVGVTDTVNGRSTGASFRVVVVNVNDPVFLVQPIDDQAALAGTPFAFTVPVETFSDEDADENPYYQTSELPEWLSFNSYSGEFTGTPTSADVGTVSITVTRTDSGGSFASDTFDLTVASSNHAPTVASPLGTVTATEDEAFTYAVPAETFADADGEELTLAVAGMPGWLSFDAATGTFSGTPGNDDVGSVTLSLTATDPHGEGVTDTFTLAVANVNDAPTVALQPYNQTAFAHAPFSTTLPANTFADIDAGDVLTLSAAEMPAWMSFEPATRRFSGTPTHADAGSSLVRVTATDLAGASVSATFGVRVVSANRAPTVTGTASGAIVRDNATANPFAAVTVADTDVPVQTLTVTVGVDDAAKGAFTPASLTAGGFVADGAVYRVAGTQAAVTAALRALVFAPAENRLVPAARETVRFTITASDGVAPVVVNAASTVQSLSVNDAPTVSLPSAPGVTRNASTTFGASTGNAILVGSRDAGPNPVRLLVSVPAGSLTVYAFAGVAVTGNGTASLRLQGNLADVNAALDGMTFAPVVGAFGSVRLRFRCDDLDAGASGLYVMAETSVTVVNTAPAAASALSFETGRDAPLNVPAATGLVPAGTDAEGDALTVRLARNPAVGALALRADGSFTYTPRAGYVGAVTFAFRYFDGQLFSGDVTVTVNVRA